MEEEFEDYYEKVWSMIPYYIISEEYLSKNKALFDEITYDMFRIYKNNNSIPPDLCCVVISTIFEKIQNEGVR